jgi:hypothetical protein
MSEEEVVSILGEPLRRWRPYVIEKEKYLTALQYSESPTSTHYRLRQVYLEREKVAEVVSYYYLD